MEGAYDDSGLIKSLQLYCPPELKLFLQQKRRVDKKRPSPSYKLETLKSTNLEASLKRWDKHNASPVEHWEEYCANGAFKFKHPKDDRKHWDDTPEARPLLVLNVDKYRKLYSARKETTQQILHSVSVRLQEDSKIVGSEELERLFEAEVCFHSSTLSVSFCICFCSFPFKTNMICPFSMKRT